MIERLVQYAMQFAGVPYKFGGQHPADGIDCSEYVQIILKFGGIRFQSDQTAASMHEFFKHFPCAPQAGALAFYGKGKISHVAFCVNSFQILEAGGGHADTLSLKDAIEHRAFVRGSYLMARTDLVGVYMPEYPSITEEIKK